MVATPIDSVWQRIPFSNCFCVFSEFFITDFVGKRLYAFEFCLCCFFLLVTIQGHLIIFLLCNIPHEKSRLYPRRNRNKRDWLSGIIFFISLRLRFSFSYVGQQRSAWDGNERCCRILPSVLANCFCLFSFSNRHFYSWQCRSRTA